MKQTSMFMVLMSTAILAILLCPMTASSQIQVGGGLGFVSPGSDYGGSTVDYYSGSKYGLSSGFNLHAKGRVNLLGFRLAAELGYSSLKNSGDSEPGQGKVDISQKIISMKVGPEYQFSLPAFPVTPYVGVNVALNSFSVETSFNGVSKVPSGTFSPNAAGRLGFGATAGALVKLNPLMGLDIGIAYNMMNVFGKSWEDADPSKDQRIDTYRALNDEKDPIPVDGNTHVVGNARSIQTLQLSATLMIGL